MFRKKSKKHEAQQVVLQLASVVSAGSVFDGDIHTQEGLLIDGVVNGNINCEDGGMVMVTKDGRINGNLNAKYAIVDGAITGDANFDRVILNSNARITGKVGYNLIRMAEGAEVRGSLEKIQEPLLKSVHLMPEEPRMTMQG